MPDAFGNPTVEELIGQTGEFVFTAPGQDPATQAAIAAFQQNTLPIIQQQFQLQGLGGSPGGTGGC